jgi:hypothetical protein
LNRRFYVDDQRRQGMRSMVWLNGQVLNAKCRF